MMGIRKVIKPGFKEADQGKVLQWEKSAKTRRRGVDGRGVGGQGRGKDCTTAW